MDTIWRYWLLLFLIGLVLFVPFYIILKLTGSYMLALMVYVFWFIIVMVSSSRNRKIFSRMWLGQSSTAHTALFYDTPGFSGETRARRVAEAVDEFYSDYERPNIPAIVEERRKSRKPTIKQIETPSEDKSEFGSKVIFCPNCGSPNAPREKQCIRCACTLTGVAK